MTRYSDLEDFIAEARRVEISDPDRLGRISFDYVECGLLVRKRFKRLLDSIRDSGGEVSYIEDRGLIESIFYRIEVRTNVRYLRVFAETLEEMGLTHG